MPEPQTHNIYFKCTYLSNLLKKLSFGERFESVPLRSNSTENPYLMDTNTYSLMKDVALRLVDPRNLVESNTIMTDVVGTDSMLANICTAYLRKILLNHWYKI